MILHILGPNPDLSCGLNFDLVDHTTIQISIRVTFVT